MATSVEGHPLVFRDIDVEHIDEAATALEAIYEARSTGLVVRGAFPLELVAAAVSHLGDDAPWISPNRGLAGGEIRNIGDAATPTFTHLRGPPTEVYNRSVELHAERTAAVFGDANVADPSTPGPALAPLRRPADLVVFDSGRHVHRVTPVEGRRARLTCGGFLTLASDRSHVAFWS